MTQASPVLAQNRPPVPQEVPVTQGQPYLPGINQATPGQVLGGHPGYDREREAREREMRERDAFDEQARRDNRERDMREREREMREREQRERQQQNAVHQEQQQLQLHQPIAVGPRMQTAIHGPNGLLATGAPPQQSPAQNAMSLFSQQFENAPRATLQQASQMPPSMLNFGTPGMPVPQSGMPPNGQQPILNASLPRPDVKNKLTISHRTRSAI